MFIRQKSKLVLHCETSVPGQKLMLPGNLKAAKEPKEVSYRKTESPN